MKCTSCAHENPDASRFCNGCGQQVVQALIDAGSLQGTRGAYRLLTPVEKLLVPSTVQAVLAAPPDWCAS
jgi:hypothetical protein